MTIIDRGGIEVDATWDRSWSSFWSTTEVVVVIVSLTLMVIVVGSMLVAVVAIIDCGGGTVVDHGDGWIVVPGGCHRHRLRWWWDHIAGVVGVRVIVVVFVDVGHGCRRL